MSEGLYSHTTRAVGTILTAAIYNADHVNHIVNHQPMMIGALSDSVAQMQGMRDPGDVGSEAVATNLAEELQSLRFALARMGGTTQWYEPPIIFGLGDVGGSLVVIGGNELQLENDDPDPTPNSFYGTDDDGDRGWIIFADEVIALNATVEQVRSATGTGAVSAAILETAAAKQTIAETGAAPALSLTQNLDWDLFLYGEVSLSANRVMVNPTNGIPGTFRTVLVKGDATPRTLTFENQFEGDIPVLTDIATGQWYLLTIFCDTASRFNVIAHVSK